MNKEENLPMYYVNFASKMRIVVRCPAMFKWYVMLYCDINRETMYSIVAKIHRRNTHLEKMIHRFIQTSLMYSFAWIM